MSRATNVTKELAATLRQLRADDPEAFEAVMVLIRRRVAKGRAA